MFFGLEIKHNKSQAKPILLDHSLHLSQAVLEPSKNGKKEPVCLMVEHNKKDFILCVLEPQCWQSQLDLEFEEGDQIRFFLRGSGNIHLTGIKYCDEDDALSLSISTDEDDLSDEVDEGELEPLDDEMPNKKKVTDQIPAKRIPTRVSNGKASTKPSMKQKLKQEEEVSNEEEDSSEDDDYILGESSDNDEDDNEDEDESGDDEDMDDEDDEIDIDEEEDEEE